LSNGNNITHALLKTKLFAFFIDTDLTMAAQPMSRTNPPPTVFSRVKNVVQYAVYGSARQSSARTPSALNMLARLAGVPIY
jgi:hypothetical protein